jgi:OB-fold nucleic acid binding domain.
MDMKKFFLILLAVIVGAVFWIYFTHVQAVSIKDVLDDPGKYESKPVTISGQVADRMSLVLVKYFKLQDKSGEITVITTKALPAIGKKVRVTGTPAQSFVIGEQQLLVFIEQEQS